MALLRFSPLKSRSPLRPEPGGSSEPSFALKLFIEAQAAICVRPADRGEIAATQFSALCDVAHSTCDFFCGWHSRVRVPP